MLQAQRKELNLFLRRLNSNLFVYSARMLQANLNTAINLGETLKEDVYFYVNTGGTKLWEVKSTNSCFVDLDAGRDRNEKYLSDAKVKVKKKKMLALIHSNPIKPHYIIETRNGYQLYWCIPTTDLKNTNKKNTWNATQYYIKEYFKEFADPRVGKANQIMRLPFTTWYKKDEKKLPFPVSMIAKPMTFRTYTLSKLYYHFKQKAKTQYVAPKIPLKPSYLWKNAPVKTQTIPGLQNILKPLKDFLNALTQVVNKL